MINPGKPDYSNTPASASRAQFGYRLTDPAAPPAVSIITPFFQGGAVFYETAESVFRQSLQQWEWILINDGSTEAEALRILDEYRRKDPRIRVVDHSQNKGLSAARNTGFREARSEFVFQLDADDLIEPTALEKMVWHLMASPHAAFTKGLTVGFGSQEYLGPRGFESRTLFLQENQVTATCMVRQSVHQAVGGYDEEIRGGLEDWDFWLKAAAHGHWGTTIREFFDWYRRRDTNREHWDNLLQKEKLDKFRTRLQQKYPNLWRGEFPDPTPRKQSSQVFSPLPSELPFQNRLMKDKPRLLFIVPFLELGGADKFNLDLIHQLQKNQGWEVSVVSTRRAKDVWQHEFENLTPDVFVLYHFLPQSDYPRFLRYLISSRDFDAICVSNSHLGYQLLPYLRAHFPDLPVVDYLHMEEKGGGGYPSCSQLYESQLTRTVVSSQHLKDYMVERGGDAQRIEVCHTNIDPELWSRGRFDPAALAKKWEVDRSVPTILYAGRICDQKQPMVFAEVMRRLAQQYPKFLALVAGDGPDLPQLKEFVDSERLHQVRFLGAVPNNVMSELLAIADVFFLPSQWEGISLALYEAMAMEVVPVGADVGGQRELVTPECGFLVAHGPNEVADYTNALQKLLKSSELRKRMSAAARERVRQHFDIMDLGRRMSESFAAARQSISNRDRAQVPNVTLATLHAAEVIEQVGAVEYIGSLELESQQLVTFAKYSVEWQSAMRTGRALVELNQPAAAVRSFQEGIRSAVASRNPKVELSARIEIAKELVPLDHELAEATLNGAFPLADKFFDPKARQTVYDGLTKLVAVLKKAAPPRPKADGVPLVTVVVPCYKHAHFLPDAVESVIAQTFSDWEMIIVDDGSPDNTSEVANRLIAKYPDKQIRLIQKPNGGLASARNVGFKAARGKYVLPLDSDDKIKPTMLEKVVPILDTHPEVGWVYTHILHFGDVDTEWPMPDFDRETLIYKNNICLCCSLCRKTMWEQVGGYNEQVLGYEDWDFWVGCAERGWSGYCVHEPLFLYRKHGHSMLTEGDKMREGLIAHIVVNHPKLYDQATVENSKRILERHLAGRSARAAKPAAGLANPTPPAPVAPAPTAVAPAQRRLRITYLISSILGVTGGNQTLLRQAEEMRRRGHDVTIVTYSPKPDWFRFETRVIQVPAGRTLASSVPASDVVVATYFVNAGELRAASAPVKVYYAQGDQYVFADRSMADNEQNRKFRELSRASYQMSGIRFVPNSHNLARAVEKLCGRKADAILPVCTDQTIFRPLQRSVPGSRFRLLIVGPDARGTEAEPLLFKGIQDIHDALQILGGRYPHFTAVRMSSTPPDIFARYPCEFYIAPSDEMKTVLFGTSHVLIYASHYDSFPRPPQEAMAAGCAVVCTATPGAMEFCRDGENSLLVPIRSPAAIADAVERLIRDHALRDKLIQGGLATAREYPREREWDEWETMLQRFMDEAASQTAKSLAPTAATPKSSRSSAAVKPAKAAPIELPPCGLVGYIGEARNLLQKSKFREAWESTLAALAMRPYHPEAYLLLAEIARTAGDSNSARVCAEHAKRLAPDWKPARQFLNQRLKGNTRLDWLTLPETLAKQAPSSASRLTVCLIAKNEEKFLDRCLASVRGFADQIVVVDTGSTDRTVEIAKEHGAEVHSFAWCDDFSAARNAALEYARGDWVLMLDADEELSAEGREVLRQEMQAENVLACRLRIIDVGREDEGCSYVPRLFRNAPGLFYVGRIHEQVFSSVEVRRKQWGLENRLSAATLIHHGYTHEVVVGRDKRARNLRLLEQAIQEMPDEPNLLMNYGMELARVGRVEDALTQYQEAFRCLQAKPAEQVVPELRESLLTQICTQWIAAKRFDELIHLMHEPLAQRGGLSASVHFSLGLAYTQLGRHEEAIGQFRQCLAKRDQPCLVPTNRDIRRAGPHHCIALCHMHMQQFDAAEKAFHEAQAADPSSVPVRFDYAVFLSRRGQPLEALKILHGMLAEQGNLPPVWLLGGQIALAEPQFADFACNWTGEAIKHFPQDTKVALQRAEALLACGRFAEALPFWQQAGEKDNAVHQAAQVLCEVGAGKPVSPVGRAVEPQVSREFLKWYQRLLAAGSTSALAAVDERLPELSDLLPNAVNTLDTAKASMEPAAVA
ncbi:MAG TPA: glycosyltransferase [Verrucomicrobiae bacterium]|nr:glycosyltransferase [Verrucomicrobiae bacterium]